MKFLLTLVIFLLEINAEARILEVMSYNVENLFDAWHDVENGKDKKDWAFLPKNFPGKQEACLKERGKKRQHECRDTDWTDVKVDLKISQIKDVVTKNNTTLPDFLGLVEVENSHVAEKLAGKLGYKNFEITTSPDERGMDVVLMYKTSKDIKKISRMEHIVPVDFATRNILEVEFLIDGRYPLTVFVNHWPSLSHPDSWRVKAAEVLFARTQDILKKNPQMNILAMGDFNTIDSNNPHPFSTVLYRDNLYSDVYQMSIANKPIDEKMKILMPLGTYYFSSKDQWNWLDHIFVNKNLIDKPKNDKKLELLIKTFEVYAPSFSSFNLKKKIYKNKNKETKVVVVPKRFEPEGTTKETIGYSDHFPIIVELEYPDLPLRKIKKTKKTYRKR